MFSDIYTSRTYAQFSVYSVQCTVAKTHSELSGRCVGGASLLMFSERVFRGIGLKKGENGSNTRGGGCEPSRHQASPPLCSLESFVATGESQAVGTYKERVTLRSRRYTLKIIPLASLVEVHLQKIFRSLRSRRYAFKKFSARCALGGTPSKIFPLATLAEVHLKIFFPLASLAEVHLRADFYLSHGHIHLYLCICPENFQKSPGHIHIKMGPDIYTGGGGGR